MKTVDIKSAIKVLRNRLDIGRKVTDMYEMTNATVYSAAIVSLSFERFGLVTSDVSPCDFKCIGVLTRFPVRCLNYEPLIRDFPIQRLLDTE